MKKTARHYAEETQELCALPDVYFRIKEMLADSQSSFNDIGEVISLDPALASKLLKIANSALFNFPRKIDSISRALTLLGTQQVNNLIETYGVTAAFSELNPAVVDMDLFWEVSVDCALLNKYLAKKLKLANADGLFLSGLFHNIGLLAIVHSEAQKVKYCEAYTKDDTPWERQLDVFGFTFSECSAELLELWHLPDNIIAPIRDYLYVEQRCDDANNLARLMYITTHLAIYNSHLGVYSKKEFISEHVLEHLGLTYADIDEALTYCNAEAMNILSVLNVT